MSASARTSFSPRRRAKKAARKGSHKHQPGGAKGRFMPGFFAGVAWGLRASAPASAADKVVLMLNWYVYGEHAPFYYGKAKGIYAAENIDLEIQEGRGSAATTHTR